MINLIAKYFNFKEKNTNFKIEIIGGITTFLTMAYALFLIPSVLVDAGMPEKSVFAATALAAATGTLIMGIFAKFPMALAPGIGLNAFFTYSVCIGMDIPWQTALSGVLASGIIFLIISMTGLRELVIKAIPTNLKFAVSSGIGLFIAFIGLKNAGIVVANESTFVGLGDLTNPTVLLSIFGLILVAILMVRGCNIAIFIEMVVTIVIGIIFGLIKFPNTIISMPPSIAPTFGVAIKNIGNIFNPKMVLVIFTFLFMDFFDTAGTMLAVGSKVGLLKKNGSIKGGSKALLSDSIATCIGSIFGTTNTTAYVESLSGVAIGAKTGFSSVVVGLLFLISLFFSPLLSVITSSITAPALIIVGSLMCSNLKEIEWDKPEVSISAFLTIILMPLTYSIGEGIACGFLSYVILMIFKGKAKKIHPVMYVLSGLFIIYFAVR